MSIRVLRFALAFAACSVGAALVFAGDYHDRGTLKCSECHVMHPSKVASARANAANALANSDDAGPLLQKDVNELCLSCHDDRASAPDVLGQNRGSSPSSVRQAGFLNSTKGVGSPASGHTLGSLDVAPGSSPRWSAEVEGGPGAGLNCIHCHEQHGGEGDEHAYRNLRSDAGNNRRGQGLVTYNYEHPGSNDLSRDVFERRALDYDESAVDFNEPNSNDSGMARFCAGCHSNFHGAPGSSAIGGERDGASYSRFLRHPSAGVDIGRAGGEHSSAAVFASRHNRVKVMSSSGSWSSPTDATPTCITCHKAHGNGNAFGLIYRSGSGALTENGDTGGSGPEALCAQCHDQASAFADN